jgi:hypothetical protein
VNELDLPTYVAICELKARYCRLLDTKDWAGFADLFTDDFELDTTGSGGTVVRGRDAAMAMVRGSIETARTAHQVHAPEISLDGETAQVIWAMQDRVVFGPERVAQIGASGLTGYGHYHERYVRQNGEWRIASSRLTRLHMDMHPVS